MWGLSLNLFLTLLLGKYHAYPAFSLSGRKLKENVGIIFFFLFNCHLSSPSYLFFLGYYTSNVPWISWDFTVKKGILGDCPIIVPTQC